jgi:hypothetical protein
MTIEGEIEVEGAEAEEEKPITALAIMDLVTMEQDMEVDREDLLMRRPGNGSTSTARDPS